MYQAMRLGLRLLQEQRVELSQLGVGIRLAGLLLVCGGGDEASNQSFADARGEVWRQVKSSRDILLGLPTKPVTVFGRELPARIGREWE